MMPAQKVCSATMNKNRTLGEALYNFLPHGCAGPVSEWFGKNHVILRISRSRRSKLGDFRNRGIMVPPVISINHDLNPYSFLVTLLHEMAHADIFFSSKKRLQPHGSEWKNAYRRIALPYLTIENLDERFIQVFSQYLNNPAASSTANYSLATLLKSYDQTRNATLITEIPENAHFSLPDGRIFIKGQKLRKRFRCECLNNKRIYLFSPMAEINPLGDLSGNT